MEKNSKKVAWLFVRYFFIVLLGVGNLYIFYKILTPITIFLVGKTLLLFGATTIHSNLIVFNSLVIELVPACVAGSAFFLLFFLVFSSANLSPRKRFFSLAFSFALLFFLNYFRIVFLVLIAANPYFDLIHWIFWHLVSIVFVFAIWILTIKIFKIKSIPVYSDFKFLFSLRKKSKRKL